MNEQEQMFLSLIEQHKQVIYKVTPTWADGDSAIRSLFSEARDGDENEPSSPALGREKGLKKEKWKNKRKKLYARRDISPVCVYIE